MAASSLIRAEEVRARAGIGGLRSRVLSTRQARPLLLDPSGFDLIAETKLASPSRGRIADLSDDVEQVVALATGMARSGAAAISVLTEPDSFDGRIEHLKATSSRVDVPVMRKDFLVDPIQVLEARAHGASGILLIARITGKHQLVEMTDLAVELGMFVLVEVFEESELETASAVFDREVLLGVNARDLTTLKVDRSRHADLIAKLPSHLPAVAESGITTIEDAADCSELGYRVALVGSSLVSSRRPGQMTRDMIEAGR